MSDEFQPEGQSCSVLPPTTRPGLSLRAEADSALEGIYTRGNRRRASNDPAVVNPCLNCGACCAYFRVSFYCGEIAHDNGAGMVPPELVTQVGPLRAAMKGTEHGHGRCVALRGEIGSADVHCGIYAQRPNPCREFEPWRPDGSPEPDCQRVRALFGLPPLPSRWVDDDDDVDPPAHAA